MSETPAAGNIEPDAVNQATDPGTTPLEPEAGMHDPDIKKAEASTVAKEPDSSENSQPPEKDCEPGANIPESIVKENAQPAADKAEPAEKAAEPAEVKAEPSENKAKPAEAKAKPAPKPKPQKPEDKPFPEFIDTLFLPAVVEQLKSHDITAERLERVDGDRPVVGGSCPMVVGELPGGRRFWLCFAKADINSQKVIALADSGSEPALLESFLIDEKRTSLPLLVSRLLQRLNGQKWLGGN